MLRPAMRALSARAVTGGMPITKVLHLNVIGRQQKLPHISKSMACRALSSTSATELNGAAPNTTNQENAIPTKLKVKALLRNGDSIVGSRVMVQGWVKTIRDQKKYSFMEITDGSSLKGVQTVADAVLPTYDQVLQVTTGAAVEIIGKVVESPAKGQAHEIVAESIRLLGRCDADYPIQKARYPLEYIRPLAHIRARTNTISSVARVRSRLAQSIHSFFAKNDVVFVQTPLITQSDCEGAGEMFRVTTLPLEGPIAKLPSTDDGYIDFKEDYFAKPAYLTVSGQLAGEAYACSMGSVYTFGPTFRAENSVGTRHLAEFHMLEPELAFADMNTAMDNAEELIKHLANEVLSQCAEDVQFFDKFVSKNILQRLNDVSSKPFYRIPYKQAIDLLQTEIEQNRSKWKYPEVHFGTDLQTEHERWLAEVHFKGCVFVHNYPRSIKPFYMRDNEDGETVDSFDLLVPGVCELIGGSQREDRIDVLMNKITHSNLNVTDYQWYIDLRRFGSIPHAGYGLGFERLVCFFTGIDNIRDAIAFPRYSGSINF